MKTKINSYLTFKISDEDYAAHTDNLLNIMELCKITQVPNAPKYLKGIINLRSIALPVIDLRLKLGLGPTVETDKTCIVVLDININERPLIAGVLVDSVQAVIELDDNEIIPLPNIGASDYGSYIEGVANINGSFIMVLGIDSVFSSEDISDIKDQTISYNKPVTNPMYF